MKKILLTLIGALVMSQNISAQSYGDKGPTLTPNNLGLVYENAIEKNEPGKVNT